MNQKQLRHNARPMAVLMFAAILATLTSPRRSRIARADNRALPSLNVRLELDETYIVTSVRTPDLPDSALPVALAFKLQTPTTRIRPLLRKAGIQCAITGIDDDDPDKPVAYTLTCVHAIVPSALIDSTDALARGKPFRLVKETLGDDTLTVEVTRPPRSIFDDCDLARPKLTPPKDYLWKPTLITLNDCPPVDSTCAYSMRAEFGDSAKRLEIIGAQSSNGIQCALGLATVSGNQFPGVFPAAIMHASVAPTDETLRSIDRSLCRPSILQRRVAPAAACIALDHSPDLPREAHILATIGPNEANVREVVSGSPAFLIGGAETARLYARKVGSIHRAPSGDVFAARAPDAPVEFNSFDCPTGALVNTTVSCTSTCANFGSNTDTAESVGEGLLKLRCDPADDRNTLDVCLDWQVPATWLKEFKRFKGTSFAIAKHPKGVTTDSWIVVGQNEDGEKEAGRTHHTYYLVACHKNHCRTGALANVANGTRAKPPAAKEEYLAAQIRSPSKPRDEGGDDGEHAAAVLADPARLFQLTSFSGHEVKKVRIRNDCF